MALAEIIKGAPTKLEIGSITADVSITEEHALAAQVTDSPVETGADLSDHRRVEPAQLTIAGLVTEMPYSDLGEVGAILQGAAPGPFSTRPKDAYADLELDFANHEPLTVITDLKVYENMVWTELRVHRDAETGRALSFSGTLREVMFADTETVAVAMEAPATAARGTPAKNAGTKAPKPAPPADNRSIAARLFDAVK